MLEASLRKLVREEAASVATGTLEKMTAGMTEVVRLATRDAVVTAAENVDRYRTLNWSPEIVEVSSASSAISTDNEAAIAEARSLALRLAFTGRSKDESAQSTVARAAVFAAFILDGTPALRSTSGPTAPLSDGSVTSGGPIVACDRPAFSQRGAA